MKSLHSAHEDYAVKMEKCPLKKKQMWLWLFCTVVNGQMATSYTWFICLTEELGIYSLNTWINKLSWSLVYRHREIASESQRRSGWQTFCVNYSVNSTYRNNIGQTVRWTLVSKSCFFHHIQVEAFAPSLTTSWVQVASITVWRCRYHTNYYTSLSLLPNKYPILFKYAKPFI